MKISDYVADLTKRLKAADILEAELEAQALIRHFFKFDLTQYLINQNQVISDAELTELAPLEVELLNHKPISKIIGLREFWKDEFIISDDVLDPRADSEILIETLLHFLPNLEQKLHMLDLGTGTGCLVLSLLREYQNATAIGADISEKALQIASKNAQKLQLEDRIEFVQSDWFSNIKAQKFDIILSNPPYISETDYQFLDQNVIKYDPKLALVGGEDGLDPYRLIAQQADQYLAEDGILIFEMGYDQAGPLFDILEDHGFSSQSFDMSKISNQAIQPNKRHGLGYDYGDNPRIIITKRQ